MRTPHREVVGAETHLSDGTVVKALAHEHVSAATQKRVVLMALWSSGSLPTAVDLLYQRDMT